MPERTLKVIIVGCGDRARKWAQVARDDESVQIVGLVDPVRANAENLAEREGLDAGLIHGTLAEAAEATDPDMVYDVSVPSAHEQVTTEALERGLHVLGEKPMSDSLDAGKRMVEAARRSGKLYAVTQTRRPLPQMISVRDFLASGELGVVEEFHCDFYLGVHFGGFRDQMPYPLILDMAVHTFDNARQLVRADPVSVYCHTWNPPHSWSAGDMSAAAIFELRGPNGEPIVYTYRGSWVNEGMHTSWEADWRCSGSKGTLRFDGGQTMAAQRVRDDSGGGMMRDLEPVEVPGVTLDRQGHDYLHYDFTEAVRSGGRKLPMCHCEDNVKTLAMVTTAVESSKSGKKLPVVWE